MSIIPKEILIAATALAKLDGLNPEQTMTLVFRALDHEICGPKGQVFNPARTPGIGKAIYAALFGYHVELVADHKSPSQWRWQAQIPSHGYSPAFEQMFIHAQLAVGDQRRHLTRHIPADNSQNSML